jgi:hypothetical protein
MMSEESADKRKSGGYTYWKRDIPDAHLLPSSEPQKLGHSASEESLGTSRTSSVGLVSAWNAGTTYEEKDITQRAKKLLEDMVCERDLDASDVELKTCTGEFHAVHVRGKVRIGYEIHKLELSTDQSSVIQIEDIDSTDPEGFSISSSGGVESSKIKTFVIKLMNDLCNKLLTE